MAIEGNVVLEHADCRDLGRTGRLIHLRETFLWLADHVELMVPDAMYTEYGAPTVDVHIPWDDLPTFEVHYEALLGEPPTITMGHEVDRHNENVAREEEAIALINSGRFGKHVGRTHRKEAGRG